jgi:hypothetical protein
VLYCGGDGYWYVAARHDKWLPNLGVFKMIIEVTYANGDKKIFIVDENIHVVNLAKLLNQYGGSVKKLEFV